MIARPLVASSLRWLQLAAPILLLAAAALPARPAHGQAANPPTVKELLAEGRLQLQQRQFAAAADTFRRANAAADGKCLECALALSEALPDNPQEAIAATREAIRRLEGEPLLGSAYCQLGDLLLRLPETSAALDAEHAYEKAADLGVTYRAEALVGIAGARLRRGLYTQAAAVALQAIQASPDDPTAGKARSTICQARRAGALTPETAPMPPAEPAPAIPWVVRQPGQSLDGDGPFLIQEAITKPRKLYAAPPVYTEEARKQRLQGTVILEAIIDRDGCVVVTQILKPLPSGLDRAALAAVEKWVFAPATLEGRPVKVYYTLTVNFQVQ